MKRNLCKTIKQLTSKGGIEGYFAEKYDKFGSHVHIDKMMVPLGLNNSGEILCSNL
jgi:hypothetical protein